MTPSPPDRLPSGSPVAYGGRPSCSTGLTTGILVLSPRCVPPPTINQTKIYFLITPSSWKVSYAGEPGFGELSAVAQIAAQGARRVPVFGNQCVILGAINMFLGSGTKVNIIKVILEGRGFLFPPFW